LNTISLADDLSQAQQTRVHREVLAFRGPKIDLDPNLIAIDFEIDDSSFHGEAVRFADRQDTPAGGLVQDRAQTFALGRVHEKNLARASVLRTVYGPDLDGPAINRFSVNRFGQSIAERIFADRTNKNRSLWGFEALWRPRYKFCQVVNKCGLHAVFVTNLGAD
jgi:hypothetical protein